MVESAHIEIDTHRIDLHGDTLTHLLFTLLVRFTIAMSMDKAVSEFATMVGTIPNQGGYLEVERTTHMCHPMRANNLQRFWRKGNFVVLAHPTPVGGRPKGK